MLNGHDTRLVLTWFSNLFLNAGFWNPVSHLVWKQIEKPINHETLVSYYVIFNVLLKFIQEHDI